MSVVKYDVKLNATGDGFDYPDSVVYLSGEWQVKGGGWEWLNGEGEWNGGEWVWNGNEYRWNNVVWEWVGGTIVYNQFTNRWRWVGGAWHFVSGDYEWISGEWDFVEGIWGWLSGAWGWVAGLFRSVKGVETRASREVKLPFCLKAGDVVKCSGQVLMPALAYSAGEDADLPYPEYWYDAIRHYVYYELYKMNKYFNEKLSAWHFKEYERSMAKVRHPVGSMRERIPVL